MIKQVIQDYWKKAAGAVTNAISNNISLLKKVSIFTALILLIFTSIFGIYNYVSMNRALSEMKQELEMLKSNVNALKENTTNTQQNIDPKEFNDFKVKTLTDIAITKLMLEQFNKAIFSISDAGKGFARVDTTTGMFFLMLDKAEQIEDGYKLSFRLGNPQNCVYNGCKLEVKWGKKYDREDDSTTREEWEKSLNSSSYTISNLLRPGQWSNFEITISPAKSEEDVQYLEIKLQTSQIILQKSSQQEE
ncbi:MAG TPA: hypothetical protein GXX37_11960 [Clostridiaceae bacterium]|nr:hypothetical protein [Clostridiaceae bacterium]